MKNINVLLNVVDAYMIVKTGTLNLVGMVDLNVGCSAKSSIFTSDGSLDPNVVPSANMEKVVRMSSLDDKINAINEMLGANGIVEMLHFTYALGLDRRNSTSLEFSFTELSKAYRPDYRANEAMKDFMKLNIGTYGVEPGEYFDNFFLIKDVFSKNGSEGITGLLEYVMEYSKLDNDTFE